MSNKRKARPVVAPRPAGEGKVVIAYIHPGTTSAFFAQSLLLTCMRDQAENRRIVNVIQDWSSANVSASRNTLTAAFLDDSDAEWLWWIDADMAWDHDALERLLAAADPVEAPVVGGLAFGASQDVLFPTIYQFTKTADDQLTTLRVGDYPDDSMVQCAATGAAFLLVHRTVLEAMRGREFNRAFPFFQETEVAGQPCGEDITFCLRAGICGFPIHVHTGIHVGHHKSHLLTHELFRVQVPAS